MKWNYLAVAVATVTCLSAACMSAETTPPAATQLAADDASSETPSLDASAPDASRPDEVDSGLTGVCADTFGDELTAGFGRIDGTVYAVQKPSDTACTMPSDDHVIVQVLMNGEVYRLVTNVLSNGADPDVRYATLKHALPEPTFAEGWHADQRLDYPSTLDVHNDDFAPVRMNDLVSKIADELKVGAKISIYAESGPGRPESAHKIHRNANEHDGAIVVDPTGSPKFLLFHFSNQTF